MRDQNKPLTYEAVTGGPIAVLAAEALGWDVRRPGLRPYIVDQAGDVLQEDSCFYDVFRLAVEALSKLGVDARQEVFANIKEAAPCGTSD